MLDAKGYPPLFYTGGWWITCLVTMPCCKKAAPAETGGRRLVPVGPVTFWSAVVDSGRPGAVCVDWLVILANRSNLRALFMKGVSFRSKSQQSSRIIANKASLFKANRGNLRGLLKKRRLFSKQIVARFEDC